MSEIGKKVREWEIPEQAPVPERIIPEPARKREQPVPEREKEKVGA